MKYVPEWVPGAGFKRKARLWAQKIKECCDVLFDKAVESFVRTTIVPTRMILIQGGFQSNGRAVSCLSSTWLSRIYNISDEAEQARHLDALNMAAATAYLAGFETVSFPALMSHASPQHR